MVQPEQPGEFDDFLADELEELDDDDELFQAQQDYGLSYVPDRCQNESLDEDGKVVKCGNLKNPAEMLCHDCRIYGLAMTGF